MIFFKINKNYLFIDNKNCSFEVVFLRCFNRKFIDSSVFISAICDRKIHILSSTAFGINKSSRRVPEAVMSIAG